MGEEEWRRFGLRIDPLLSSPALLCVNGDDVLGEEVQAVAHWAGEAERSRRNG